MFLSEPGHKRLPLNARTNKPSQSLAIDWLLQAAIERPALASGLIFCCADKYQHRRRVGTIAPSNFCRKREAIHVRHLQINQHHIKVRAGQQGQRLGSGADRATSMMQPLSLIHI